MKKLLLALGLGAMVMTASAATASGIILKPGQDTVQVSLPANATTGYQWFVKDYDHNLLTLKNYQYVASPTNGKVGVGGTANFTFAVNDNFYAAPQTTEVNFIYKQPWNPDVKAVKMTAVNISSVAASQK